MKVRTLAVVLASFLTAVAIILFAEQFIRFAPLGGKNVLITDQNITLCRRSVDRVFVVDEEGRVCKWQEVDYGTGCCPPVLNGLREDSCQECKVNCCGIYAYCVSCCLQPQNPMQPNFSSPDFTPVDKFDYCRTVCRTSSRSVINENQWKSDLKYCFPNQLTPLPSKPIPSETPLDEKTTGFREKIISFASVLPTKTDDYLNDDKQKSTKPPEPTTTVPTPQIFPDEDMEVTLSEIAENQKKQETLLEKLEEKMKKLVEENQHLAQENKNLSEKLEQVTKGKLELEITKDKQNRTIELQLEQNMRTDIKKGNDSKSREGGSNTSDASWTRCNSRFLTLVLIGGLWILNMDRNTIQVH